MAPIATPAPVCAQTEATPWIALAAAWTIGLALTAGWTIRTAWAATRRPETIAWLRSAR